MVKLRVIVDRVEGDRATLFFEGAEEAFFWPRKLLPASSKEGDVLLITVRRSSRLTKRRLSEVSRLIESLAKSQVPEHRDIEVEGDG
ncbi:MAG TPA: DUF3006 domain-containing protein [Actinobacteria bacterium]|nr:DUF3006 domain-containing protein [Actinomycetota bacterium]